MLIDYTSCYKYNKIIISVVFGLVHLLNLRIASIPSVLYQVILMCIFGYYLTTIEFHYAVLYHIIYNCTNMIIMFVSSVLIQKFLEKSNDIDGTYNIYTPLMTRSKSCHDLRKVYYKKNKCHKIKKINSQIKDLVERYNDIENKYYNKLYSKKD